MPNRRILGQGGQYEADFRANFNPVPSAERRASPDGGTRDATSLPPSEPPDSFTRWKTAFRVIESREIIDQPAPLLLEATS